MPSCENGDHLYGSGEACIFCNSPKPVAPKIDAVKNGPLVNLAFEALQIEHPGAELQPNGRVWLPGGVTPQTSGTTIDLYHVCLVILAAVREASR